MPNKHRYGNPDLRRRTQVSAPPNETLEARLRDLLTPGTFANLKDVKVEGQPPLRASFAPPKVFAF